MSDSQDNGVHILGDIPALDSVSSALPFACEARLRRVGILLLWIAAAAGAAGACYLYARGTILAALAAVALGGLATLALIYSLHLLYALFYWTTDANGITVCGLLGRSRNVEWSEVESVQPYVAFGDQLGKLTLFTSQDCLEVPARPPTDKLAASVLQHLGEYRKPNADPDLADLLSYWWPTPQEIPRHTEWSRPKPRASTGSLAAVALFALLAAGLVVIQGRLALRLGPWWFWGAIAVWGISGASMTWSMWRLLIGRLGVEAIRVVTDDESITVETPRRSFTIPWAECKRVAWSELGGLVVGRETGKDYALIPCSADKRSSRDVTLAAIRRLREDGLAISVPAYLRSVAPTGNETTCPIGRAHDL